MRAGLELPIQDVIEAVHGEPSLWHTPTQPRLRASVGTCQWLGKSTACGRRSALHAAHRSSGPASLAVLHSCPQSRSARAGGAHEPAGLYVRRRKAELFVNLKTARALGIDMPCRSYRADEVIK